MKHAYSYRYFLNAFDVLENKPENVKSIYCRFPILFDGLKKLGEDVLGYEGKEEQAEQVGCPHRRRGGRNFQWHCPPRV